MKHHRRLVICLPLFALLTACSESPAPEKKAAEPAKPVEPVGAQYAFHQMFLAARSWARDAAPLRMGNLDLKEPKSAGGKAAAWECTFVSESGRVMRRYTYSVVDSPENNLRAGPFGASQDGWSPGGSAAPFPMQAFKVDSTKAYEVAMAKGADYAKKHRDSPMKFILESTRRFPNAAWRVVWGESVATSGYSIFVDATTGDYLQTAR